QQLLGQVEELDRQGHPFEQRIQATFKATPAIQRLLTLPGGGDTLAGVIALEGGDVARFASAERLAGYAGTPPRVRGSGGGRAAVGTGRAGCQPLPQVGIRRSGERDLSASRAGGPPPRESPL